MSLNSCISQNSLKKRLLLELFTIPVENLVDKTNIKTAMHCNMALLYKMPIFYTHFYLTELAK